MMNHPIDIPSREDQERATPPAGRGGGIWTIAALVVIVALAVAVAIAMSGGEQPDQPAEPVPSDAPAVPGE